MNIKQERKNAKLTQTDLAVKVGVSLTTIRMWEKNVTKPTPENMEKLLKVLEDAVI